MTLLNATDAVPSVLIIIYRFLLAAPGPVAVDDLAGLLAPGPLQPAGDQTSIFRGTLRTCAEIGLVSIERDQARLHPDLPDAARDPATGEASLRKLTRDLILAPDVNDGDLWDGSVGMRDFSRAIAWLLTKDPFDPPGTYELARTAQNRDFEELRLFNTRVRWVTFQRWATFLEFGWIDNNGKDDFLQVDPTPIVRDLASQCLADRSEWPMPLFVEELGRRIPVFDGGTYRRQVEDSLNADRDRSDLSLTLGLTLRRLEAEGLLRLTKRSDIESLGIVDSVGSRSTYSHLLAA